MPHAILYWNAVALEADRISHTREPKEQAGPTLSSRALAIIHLAMYDAYSAINPAARHPNASAGGYVPALARGKHRVDPDNPTQGYHGGQTPTRRRRAGPPPSQTPPLPSGGAHH